MNENELVQCKAEWQNVDRMPRGEERNNAIVQWCEDWIEILMEDLNDQRIRLGELESIEMEMEDQETQFEDALSDLMDKIQATKRKLNL